jgi:MFS family permease
MPDMLGRKHSMSLIMSVYVVASALTLYGDSIALKTVGMFLQGALHIKSTLSYTYILEMVPEKNKEICVTLITLFDESTLIIMATGL